MSRLLVTGLQRSVTLAGSADKRAITATFVETLNSVFLPIQQICQGKTSHSFPNIEFLSGFSLNSNDTHFSTTQESIDLFVPNAPFLYPLKTSENFMFLYPLKTSENLMVKRVRQEQMGEIPQRNCCALCKQKENKIGQPITALSIQNIFRGQESEPVVQDLKENNILNKYIY